jgi:hypothetical protein
MTTTSKNEVKARGNQEFVAPDCPGFLLIHKVNATGTVTDIEIREIIIRNDRTFYPYTKDDAESRNRAKDKARTAADYETATYGLDKITFTELSGCDIEVAYSPTLGEFLLGPPHSLTTGEKILRKLGDILDILWENRKARKSQDIMCQNEVELLLEGFRLGQKTRDK